MADVTVCIPACNEEKTIEQVLDYCIDDENDGIVKHILVCANGCSPEDRTKEIVKAYCCSDERVALLECEKGKPRAWNTLVRSSETDLLVFFDGDVMPEEGTIAALVNELESKKVIAASCRLVPDMARKGFEYWLVSCLRNRMPQVELIGGGYAFRKERLLNRLSENGFKGMPETIEGDDWFLQLNLYQHELSICSKAAVHINAGDMEDYLRNTARTMFKAEYLSRRWPELFQRWEHDFSPKTFGERFCLLASSDRGFVRAAANYLLRQAVHFVYCHRIMALYNIMQNDYYTTGDPSLLLPGVARAESTKAVPVK